MRIWLVSRYDDTNPKDIGTYGTLAEVYDLFKDHPAVTDARALLHRLESAPDDTLIPIGDEYAVLIRDVKTEAD